VALVGANMDGHDFVADASGRQAACVVLEKNVECSAPTKVIVPDTRHALASLAAKYHDFPSRELKVLGVTGTNGKTTVTYLIKSILEEKGRRTGLLGTIEYLAGKYRFDAPNTTPESLQIERLLSLMKTERIRVAVMEVSSHALKTGRVRMIEFSTVGITNLSQDHLDFHVDMEDYRNTKALLFDKVHGKDKWAILNIDDPEYDFFKGHVDSSYLTFSTKTDRADLYATNIETGPEQTRFHLVTPLGEEDVASRLVGEHNVSNAVCAAAFAMAAGMDAGTVRRGLEATGCVPGRLESVENDRGVHVLVDYAHTPDALEHVCSTCRKLANRRLVVLFGCGGDRDRSKRRLMGEAVSRYADRMIVTSDNPRTEDPAAIIEDIKPGLDKSVESEIVIDRKDAIRAALTGCSEGDVLLVAGKGHEDYMIVGTERIHFDDREVIRELLKEIG
jgi:UDP-N-acetylmuramoyl-L-alanyl-D-glutamate--2,6-diaminopimelate ligase